MSKQSDSLGDRMKAYEKIPRNYLTRRVPVIIRLDGKAFHTFTKGLKKPFDSVLASVMQDTMKYLCENVQGCVLGYTQSDEITLVLTDYATITTDSWFGYNVQKMTSIAASMATLAFNKNWEVRCSEYLNGVMALQDFDTESAYLDVLESKSSKALFDARAFSIPKEEVCNCLIWRQQDATRNSIEAVGQAFFSTNELHKKTCSDIQEMLWAKQNINWNNFPTESKRGSCCIKQSTETTMTDYKTGQPVTVLRRKWVVDREIPIFTQARDYIEQLL